MNKNAFRSGRTRIAITVLLLVVALPITAQSFGGGISVFVPWDMFEGETGSLSFETSAETALGLGEYFSIPLGVAYNQVYGASVTGTVREDDSNLKTSGPWFYTDSLLPYLLGKITIPAGPLYFELFGGGALNWNASVRPFHDRIARDLRDAGAFGATSGSVAVTDLTVNSGIGYGWVAGASAGVRIDQISVGLTGTYRHIYHDLTIEGEYFRPDDAGSTFDTNSDDFAVKNLTMLMNGISIGINGSFSM
ncbi:MAG: hypothetical protein PF508_03865 [Spirochaeta sp.]|jgi:hypothetical protein|nr:hypothetical protein [Spirochaeta sp.]